MSVQVRGPFASKYPAWCLSCGAAVKFGDPVFWVRDVGVWHRDCEQPRSLAMYVKEAEQKKAFGR